MGKSKRCVDKMKPKFISQAAAKDIRKVSLEKIWKDWEAFAEYAFNKSPLPVMHGLPIKQLI
jgi:DNA polymerase-3 subunit alpha